MAIYKKIQGYVKINFDYTSKTCWLARYKTFHGLSPSTATNRKDLNKQKYPHPEQRQKSI